jgi:hypothetical protein
MDTHAKPIHGKRVPRIRRKFVRLWHSDCGSFSFMATTTKDPLVERTDQLEQAFAAGPQGQEQAWLQRVRNALSEVKRALGQHPAPTEQNALAPAGPPQREISPGLTRQVHTLRKDHQAMLREVDDLVGQLERNSIRAEDLPSLRQTGTDLVKSLRDFTAAENKMILEAVMGEPGAGD